MDTSEHTLVTLFEQLGLPSDDSNITDFVEKHRPLGPTVKLHKASWWSPSQAAFLQEAIAEDAEWAETVDELDALLRHSETDQVVFA